MTALRFAIGAYARPDMPRLRVVNQYVEQTPAADSGDPILMTGRPGLVPFYSVGLGPIRGLISQPGAFAGDIFAVSGSGLYRAQTLIGTIGTAALVDMYATPNRLMIANSVGLYVSNGTTTVLAAFPDGAGVMSVAYLNGYSLASRANSRRIYFTLNPDTWDGLDYFSAEQDTGAVVGMAIVQERLWVFCQRVTEVFVSTGNADAPFERLSGQFYDQGAAARDTIAKGDNSVFWVGTDRIVYRADATPVRISDHGIEAMTTASNIGDLVGWQFTMGGHVFYALRTTSGTVCYDAATQQWHELESLNRSVWRARVGIMRGIDAYAGDDEDGTIWRLDKNVISDDGGDIERRVTAMLPIGAPMRIANLVCDIATGETDSFVDAPQLEARLSRDRGKTWGDWQSVSLGTAGEYRRRAVWRRWGLLDEYSLFELRTTDRTPYAMTGIRVNESLAGRGRPG